jgi:lipoate-protein ligase A
MEIDSSKNSSILVKVKDRMFSHGTLMLNSDLGEVQNALKVNPKKIHQRLFSK